MPVYTRYGPSRWWEEDRDVSFSRKWRSGALEVVDYGGWGDITRHTLVERDEGDTAKELRKSWFSTESYVASSLMRTLPLQGCEIR